ncbi:MAG: hypothetical protein INF43_00800, partial [Alphaproteobacteria bacterium]|nr:hypothetical protein [Alphaproteobacteria bacterium]
MLHKLNFRQKIIFSLILMGLLPAMINGAVSTYKMYTMARDDMQDSINSLSTSIKLSIEHYFLFVHAQSRVQAMDPRVLQVAQELISAANELDPASVTVDTAALKARYRLQQEKTPGTNPGQEDAWLPSSPRALALQHL